MKSEMSIMDISLRITVIGPPCIGALILWLWKDDLPLLLGGF
jgi:hypothetical protein